MKKKFRFNKNKVLKVSAYISIYACILSAFMADGDSHVPFIVFIVSLSWLFLFAYANDLLGRFIRK